jgi:hypothetical protein
MAVICAFGGVAEEMAQKAESLLSPARDQEAAFLALCAQKLPPRAIDGVKSALAYAGSLKTADGEHASIQAYLSHPIRVAELTVSMQIPASLEAVQLALLHNVFEVCAIAEDDIVAAGFSGRIAQGIRKQTINRDRQWDDDYLTGYYRDIEDFGSDLALIKCLDKIDNFLGMRLFDDSSAVWRPYISTGHRYVGPMARRLSPDLGAFCDELVGVLLSAGSDVELVARYKNFLDDERSRA